MKARAATTVQTPTAPAGVPARYRGAWGLFTDWCAATDRHVLPADPVTVAMFLDALPAARSTLRARATAINTVYIRAGYRPPGAAEAIRVRLSRRATTPPDMRARAEQVIAALPTHGWTAGLFGRRDALMLMLSGYERLPYVDIARLRRRDVTPTDDGGLRIAGGHDITLDGDCDNSKAGAMPVYVRWAYLQAHMDRYPSPTATARALRAAHPITAATRVTVHAPAEPRRDGPLLPRFDQWGSAPLARSGLSRQAVSIIIARHLAGTAPPHREPIRRPVRDTTPVSEGTTAAPPPPLVCRHDQAVTAKRTATERLSTLTDQFNDADERIDALLARTANLVDECGA